MNVSVVLLFEQLRTLEECFALLYKSLSELEENSKALQNISKVLMREEERHITLYENLMAEYKNKNTIMINKDILVRVEYNIIMLKQGMNLNTLNSPKELISLAINYENKSAFLLQEIMTFLKENTNEAKDLFAVFEILLAEEKKHADNLSIFLN
ncbi:hypothetical protein [Natranaerovirga pectinivora]|uniref:hypothetical protein n=1 Tax=Natranaerovirga pectinivora TaxID=682400 RepID=UPI00104345DC|nr:hypothetical protein [Natranaerovirga pectinivora]